MEREAHAAEIERQLALLGLSPAERARFAASLADLEREAPARYAPVAGLLRRAAESSRLKSVFLRLSMRELEGPFGAVQRQVTGLSQESDPWRVREEMGGLVETVFRLNRLIRDLIDTADIESGAARFSREEVDLASLFSDRISKRLRRLRGYRVVPEFPPHPLVFSGDRLRLTLLIDDLLDAAIHLTPGGGTLLAGLARENGRVVLSTRNRSARIPTAQLAAFLEYLQAEKAETGGLEGVGIGLYRAYRTAQMLGGRIEIAAPREGGAVFTVWLPSETKESTEDD